MNSRLFFPLALACSFAACGGTGKSDSKAPPEPPKIAPPIAAQTGSSRLSTAQYRNVVHDLFGADIVVPAALEPDTEQDGFISIGGSFSSISPRGVEQYEKASYDIAAQALKDDAKRTKLLPCLAMPMAATCPQTFAVEVGRRLWRRPLTPEELEAIGGIITKATNALTDPYLGLQYGLAALLQSPHFLFRPEVGEAGPSGLRRYSSYEMASRLSFFLWNSTPDDALLDAAKADALVTDAGMAEQTRRLLASPKARPGFRNFVTEYLGLGQLDALSKDPIIFTTFSPDLGKFAREETERVFERIAFDDDGDFRDVFTTRRTFVNPKLASLYAVLAPNPDGFAEVTLPADGPRQGLLGHISILALNAHAVSSSATLRGKFIRTVLLCGKIPPPPVNVNTALPEPSGTTRTLRERVREHLSNPACSSCHLQMDPIGLGLENFDGIGRFRHKDHDADIDPRGDIDGLAFANASELGQVLHDHPDAVSCFARHVFRYATSFTELPRDADTIDALAYDFRASGHKIKALLFSVAMSPGFRLSGDPR